MKKTKLIIALLTLFACAGVAFAQENLVFRGDMEGGTEVKQWTDKGWVEEGSSLSLRAGQGVSESTGLYVRGKYNWSGVGFDLTKKNIVDGSDYYVEVWFKADKADKADRYSDVALCIQPSDCSEEDYDDFIYMGLDPDSEKYSGSRVKMSNKEYVKVSGIIIGEEIKNQLAGRGATTVTIYFKTDNPMRPYYIDNVVIKKIQ